MRLRPAGLLAAVLLVAGCGAGGSVSASAGPTSPPAPSGESGGATPGTPAVSPTAGDADCAALTDAAATLGLAVQLMPQLTSAESYQSIREGVLPYDPAAVAAAIETLRALEGYPTTLGSVRESLDTYAQGNDLVEQNLAAADPFATGGGQDLIDLTSDVTSFITRQAALSQALELAGCA